MTDTDTAPETRKVAETEAEAARYAFADMQAHVVAFVTVPEYRDGFLAKIVEAEARIMPLMRTEPFQDGENCSHLLHRVISIEGMIKNAVMSEFLIWHLLGNIGKDG